MRNELGQVMAFFAKKINHAFNDGGSEGDGSNEGNDLYGGIGLALGHFLGRFGACCKDINS